MTNPNPAYICCDWTFYQAMVAQWLMLKERRWFSWNASDLVAKCNATVGLDKVNYSGGGCIFWSESSKWELQVACQSHPMKMFAAIIKTRPHRPGDDGIQCLLCVLHSGKAMRRNSHFWMPYIGQGRTSDCTGISLCPASAPFKIEQAVWGLPSEMWSNGKRRPFQHLYHQRAGWLGTPRDVFCCVSSEFVFP